MIGETVYNAKWFAATREDGTVVVCSEDTPGDPWFVCTIEEGLPVDNYIELAKHIAAAHNVSLNLVECKPGELRVKELLEEDPPVRYISDGLSATDYIYLIRKSNMLLLDTLKKYIEKISAMKCQDPTETECVVYLKEFPNWELCPVCQLKRDLHLDPFVVRDVALASKEDEG